MPVISFSPSVRSSYTPVSDTFLLQYMPAANGAYVKVYLYFLHYSMHPGASITSRSAADTLFMIESDVLEALRYWQEKGLLRLVHRGDSVELLFLDGTTPPPSGGEPKPTPEVRPSASPAAKVIRVEQKPTYSPDELSIYSREPQIQHLFSIASQYLGQVLSQPNLSTLYSFYDYYRLPLDVIEYLIQYCVRNGHRDLRYMERVVQDWADQGIQNVAQAQMYIKRLDVYRPIMKTLGLGRYPTDDDCSTFDRWISQYQMSMEMILEACRRTMDRIKTPSFPYVEGILSDWHAKGVHTLTALQGADTAYEQQQAALSKEGPSRTKAPRTKNAFLNYTQRSDVDYDELEQELAALKEN
ncbi:MAG: DnaD domain protein [Firmicutes bacterium]|nr:DnaD domain protein [Bacillota bacterium]